MKIKIWGAQGSMPTPLKPNAVKEKIIQAILGMPDLDSDDPDLVRAYVEALPPLLRGTAKGNTSCVEVQTRGETFIIDAGTGIRELGLELLKGPCGRGEGKLHILFSHHHWDHIQGFPLFLPAFIPGNQIRIYSIHDLELALTEQQRYLFFPVSLDSAQAERELAQLEPEVRQRYDSIPAMQAQLEFVRLEVGKPFSIGPVTVNTSRNHHPGDAYSYRFEDQYSILVYGGDAEYKDLSPETFQERVDFFNNADVVIFDAQYGLRDSWENKVDYGHSSAMIGVDFARRAGVKKLVLTHHEPTYSDLQLLEIQETATAYQTQDPTLPTCELILAYEDLEIDLTPPGAVGVRLMPDEEAAVLTPGSVFDEQGVAQLVSQLAGEAGSDTLVGSIVDLSQVERLTTASLKTLVAYSWQREEGPIVLAASSPRVEEVIKLGGYGDYFAIYPTVAEAVKAVQAREALNLPGQTINNRYQITEILSRSSIGTVLKVFDQTNQHEAALRIISPAFRAETIDRFVDQMARLLELNHRNIAQVYQCDRSQEGSYAFVVEEMLIGPTLFERLVHQAKSMNSVEALELATTLMRALEYAHSRGVIHGNLKPQDIFLTDGGVKISGFNLGLLEEDRKLLNAPVRYADATYLAPEQILGQPMDARTDLYFLGVILYQLFTGRLPFTGTDQEVMQAHLAQTPKPPREHNPALSRSLEHLILKLLAKNPNERYASARQTRQITSSLMSGTGENGQPGRQHLVGRQIQLRTLQERWLAAEAGNGQIVFISGEPGIGKSSLARQQSLQSEAPVVLVGTCQEKEGQPTYHLFSQVLQTYLVTVPPEISDPEMRRWLSHFSHLAPELKQIVPNLPEPSKLEPEQARLRLMSSLTQFIKQATQGRSWMLILDDLQWIDEGSAELLHYLSRHLGEMSLMIMGAYRDTEVGNDHLLQPILRDLDQNPAFLLLPLDRLGQADVLQLLGYLWDPTVPKSLSETIYRHTEGNPLYTEEVAKGLADDGLVTREAGLCHFPDVENVRLPQGVHDAVERRIHFLNAETRGVLSESAVLGQRFRFADLVTLSDLPEWTVLDHLDLALERQLVQEVKGGEMLRFRHAEIHQVIYDDLGMLRRRRLHHRAGEMIEQRIQPVPERQAGALAYHFFQAQEYERALLYYIKAGDSALRLNAPAEAIGHYIRGLACTKKVMANSPATSQQLVHLYSSLGRAYELDNQFNQALEHYQEMGELAAERDDKALMLASLTAQCIIQATPTPLHNHERARELGQQAMILATELGDRATEARVLWALLLVEVFGGGDNYKALTHGLRSLEIARQEELKEQVGYTLTNLIIVYQNLDRLADASEALQEAQSIWRELDNKPMLADCLTLGQMGLMLEGKYRPAVAAGEEGYRVSQSVGNLWNQTTAQVWNTLLYAQLGEIGRAIQAIESAHKHAEEARLTPFAFFIKREWVELYLKMGAVDQADRLSQELAEGLENTIVMFRDFFTATTVRLKIATGLLDQAEEVMNRTFPQLDIDSNLIADVVTLVPPKARLELALGRPAIARLDLEQLINRYTRTTVRIGITESLYLYGRVLQTLDEAEPAREALWEAHALATEMEMRWDHWQILAALAEIEEQLGDEDAARSWRRQALEIVEYIAGHIGREDLRLSFLSRPDIRSLIDG